jgi:hypothetical protein
MRAEGFAVGWVPGRVRIGGHAVTVPARRHEPRSWRDDCSTHPMSR